MISLALILFCAAAAFAQPATNCPVSYGSVYVADVSNACIYYDCTNGFAVARSCGPGTGVLHASSRTYSHNPCETYYGPCIRGKGVSSQYGSAPQPSYQAAPQPAYQPAPQPAYQPAPQPAYQPASYQPASQSSYQPASQSSYQPASQSSYQPASQPSYGYHSYSHATESSVVVQVLPGFHAIGGYRVEGIFTQMQCYEKCLKKSGCQSADYDTRDKTCWIHMMNTGCDKVEAKEGCVHLIIKSCDIGGSTTNAPTTTSAATTQPSVDTAFTGFQVFGGTPVNATTAVTCLSMCGATTGCQAIDFNFATNRCFLHFAATACNEPRAKESCTHFRLMPCPTQTPTQAPAPVAILPPDYFPVSRPVVETLYGQCLGGGILDTLATSYYECFMNCSFGGVSCVGFDFNFVTKECRIHTVVDECITAPVTLIGCNHYRFVNCTVFNPPAFIPEATQWCVESGVQLFGGVEDPNAPTYEICLVTCKASAGCAGFDFDFATGRCLKHTVQTECNANTIPVPAPTFAHFRKTEPAGTNIVCPGAMDAPITGCVLISEIQLVTLLDLGSATGVREALRQSLIAQLQTLARSQEALSLPQDVQATLNVVFDPNFINALTETEAQELLTLYEQLIQQVQAGTTG